MSQRAPSQQNYGSARSPSRTQRPNAYNRQGRLEPQYTEVQIHEDSPTRHDVQFYIRKINRYQVEISRLEHDLSVAQFRLSKAEDFEIKYDSLFKDNQKVVKDHEALLSDFDKAQRDLNRLEIDQEQSSHLIRDLQAEVDTLKKANQGLRFKQEQLRTHSTTKGQEERGNLRETYNKNLEVFKKESKQIQQKLKKEIQELKGSVSFQETIQSSLNAKLEHIKREKNSEISRLKQLVSSLRDELGNTNVSNEENARASRNQLISDTQDRLNHVRNLESLIEDTLMQEINNLNETLNKKNRQILFLIECDKKQLQSHESSEKALKNLIQKLEDKIFTIQRENELELYETVERLKKQYQENMDIANSEWQQALLAHENHVEALRKQINSQQNQIQVLTNENKIIQAMHTQAKIENSHSINMLSQKIIGMQTERDDALKNYTTSMKQIEDDAKSKLDDLHTAIKNKNNQTEILTAQINLKNGEITHLLEEISRLRDLNRQKLKKLESTNATEQNNLNKEISDLKQEIFRLKRNLHEVENQMEDNQASFKLEKQLSSQELQAQRQANELLKSRNKFLAEWCHELERDLKLQRVSNVNILHDQNISQRENIQIREQVRVELEAVKNKQLEQVKNIHKLEKNRLQSQLAKREHELRDKKEQLGRLLVQYKALEGKVGKSSKVDKSAEDSAKCRATLQSEVKLTENLFNAINCS